MGQMPDVTEPHPVFLFMTSSYRLYDLEKDPGELRDVRSEHPEIAAGLHAILLDALPESERERLAAMACHVPERGKQTGPFTRFPTANFPFLRKRINPNCRLPTGTSEPLRQALCAFLLTHPFVLIPADHRLSIIDVGPDVAAYSH